MDYKLIIINGDDLGMCPGANEGILRAHREGILTSASIIVTTPYYKDALECVVKKNPNLGIGIHLSLTAGKSISSLDKVPLLVDKKGNFKQSFSKLLYLLSTCCQKELLYQIELEFDAQLRKLISDGVVPDHINSERHIHLIKSIFEMVCKLMQKYSINYLRYPKEFIPNKFNLGLWGKSIANGNIFKYFIFKVLTGKKSLKISGIITSDYFVSILHTGQLSTSILRRFLNSLPFGITEVMVHPGFPLLNQNLQLVNESLKKYLNSKNRLKELQACTELNTANFKCKFINFKELKIK